jgi:hypothetical protein
MATKKTTSAPSTAAAPKQAVSPSGTVKLSKFFSLSEMSRSEAAQRGGFDNTPGPDETASLTALCQKVLDPLREAKGKPIRVNSGYRGPDANKAVGGSATSQHCKGEAADIEIDGYDNKQLAQDIISMKLPFDQLILEFYVPGDPNSGWVHVSHKREGKQRGEVLRAVREGGKTAYKPGLG